MGDNRLVWSDEHGDMRKKKDSHSQDDIVDESSLTLSIRRLTSGKGRAVIQIGNLPSNKSWCKKLAKELKKVLGVGGSYKKDFIEVHGEKLSQVCDVLDAKSINWKKIGG